MLTTPQLTGFYLDLQDERVESALGLVHSRFSTNTFPSWPLAHPYRRVAHNGEINTVTGNENWMRAREALIDLRRVRRRTLDKIFPICTPGASDTARFDEVLELLHLGGRSLPHAVLMMIPEAWERHENMDPARRAFYEYHSTLMEPWDGPASVCFTDGTVIGAVLDRNGLRPCRIWVTEDGLVVLASEVGVLDIDPSRSCSSSACSRAGCSSSTPRRAASSATTRSRTSSPAEQPYQEWLDEGLLLISRTCPTARTSTCRTTASLIRQQIFGYTTEELNLLLSADGQDRRRGDRLDGHRHPDRGAVAAPAAAVRLLPAAVRAGDQPAAGRDPRRDRHQPGQHHRPEGDLLQPGAGVVPQISLPQPILHNDELAKLVHINDDGNSSRTSAPSSSAACTRSPRAARACARRWTPSHAGLRGRSPAARASSCCRTASRTRSSRRSRRCCSPRPCTTTWCASRTRTKVGLIVEAGDAREVHHMAVLLGCGAAAVNPYMAFETIEDMLERGAAARASDLRQGRRELHQGRRQGRAQGDVEDGHLHARVLHRCPAVPGDRPVAGTRATSTSPACSSQLGGIGLDEIAADVAARHAHRIPATDPRSARTASSRWAASTSGVARASTTCSTRTRCSSCSTPPAPVSTRSSRSTRKLVDDQSERLASLRGLFRLQDRKRAADLDRRGRAGQRDRQAVLDRRDELRLDLRRGARDPRHRDEPARRPLELR